MFRGRCFRIVIPVALTFVFPEVASANSGFLPIFPLLSVLGWMVLPVIILLEGAFYARKSVRYPFRLSLYSNLWSAFVGLLVDKIAPNRIYYAPFGPAYIANLDMIRLGIGATIVGLVFHWWFSSHLEHMFSKWHKLWRNPGVPLSLFYKANRLSYGMLSLFFLVRLSELLFEYYMQ